jgi:nitroreductase
MTFNKNISLIQGVKDKVSHPRLTEPAPGNDILDSCYKAAFRSPDHGYLRPWRFIECRDSERDQLGQLLENAISEETELAEVQRQKLENTP